MSKRILPEISVIGYGCITAAGATSLASWDALQQRRVNNKIIPSIFEAPCFYVDEENSTFQVLSKSDLRPHNRTISLALFAIDEALYQAGLTLEDLRGKRVGLALGTTVGNTFHNEAYYMQWENGEIPDPAPLHQYFDNNLALYIQRLLGINGPRVVITNACASGTDAIGLAKIWLEQGLCDLAIAGGADALSRVACNGFKSLRLIAGESCRPFDKNRQGLNPGEAAGVFIMERDEQSDHKKLSLGFVKGYGIAGDAFHPTAPHPQGRGLQLAIRAALLDAQINRQDICMINAHGTGTPSNDIAETQAVFEAGIDPSVPMVSTKGITGHTLGAAGGVEAVLTLLTLNHGHIIGTVGCTHPDPLLNFPVIPEAESQALAGIIGISQSLAFGGSNSVLIIEGGAQ
ncbi:beta-ketoacyl-[acyl-carrier-protein] synthase family protein [Desulforhopalus vacuolatus]|uniref:beta-ketoacyl-[acyl-carrier-protein] synthase family protein n=1 Tax=Desulforhopalus vacuolatus TaxID=40414 RepID=UPI0019652F12|nr:beta-ketoacyl-[acyl-carrier-protein] synthase family protein [Desulforhopalus vacuolatus]MBM9519745.1 beta-ketoacyl-[acyl-carrier-protein] synthase family protein [Desulforhopalus vacuolatus]